VFEALSDSKLTQILAPVLGAPNFSKLSFNKQKDMVLEKLNASEFQQRKARHKEAVNGHQLTAE
jgi:hypothetical protein